MNRTERYSIAWRAAYPLKRFMSDARNYEEIAVDFVYTSAKIEGNTYDRIDTDNLLKNAAAVTGL